MTALCLLVAGVVRAALPAEITLAWVHSVQKTAWEERYSAADGTLRLVEARIQGSGAGMEAAPGAVLRDGWWVWRPNLRLDRLQPVVSAYAADYRICTGTACTPLAELAAPLPEGAVVTIEPCAREAAVPPRR